LVLIAAATGVLFGGSYAAFTGSGSDSGAITTGYLEIFVLGTDNNTLDYEIVGQPAVDCDAVTPGTVCADRVNVTNIGTVPVTLSLPTAEESGPLEDCYLGDSLSTAFDDLEYVPDSTVVGPAGMVSFRIVTTFDPDADATCAGLTGTVVVTVDAESVPLP
jgi:hypothetical protein